MVERFVYTETVNGSSPLSLKMVYSVIHFWNIFLVITVIFFLYCIFYFKYIGGFHEILWKICYTIISWCIVFIYLFFESDFLLKTFFQKIDDSVIIKDLQDLVNLSLDLAYIFSFYSVTPLAIFFIWTYIIGCWKNNQILAWKYVFYLTFYFLFIFKFFLDTDLFLSGWNFFNKKTTYGFDFQPDLVYIIIGYIGDYYDFSFFFIYFLIIISYLNNSKINLLNKIILNRFFFSKIIFLILNNLFMFYFFGGENLYRDFFLFTCNFFIIEIYYFSYLFLFNVKRKKI